MYRKILKYTLIFVLGTLWQCTKIYEPDINSDVKALIVEGLITDEPGPYSIKLSMAKPLPFDSVGVQRFDVHDAKVTIMDNLGNTYNLMESSSGNYSTPGNFRAKVGSTYKLSILMKDGKRYESTPEKLLAPESIDSIRAFYSENFFVSNDNILKKVAGADIRVDLFNSLKDYDTIPSCRFVSKVSVQYFYSYREQSPGGGEIKSWHWENFGWRTVNLNPIENLTEAKYPSSKPSLKNHLVGFMPYKPEVYDMNFPDPTILYFLRLDQYTLNKSAYKFYSAANKQLSADGKIFDPIASQLYGNMRCINDPSKIVLGLFEVSSVKKYAFVVDMLTWTIRIRLLKAPIMDMPKDMDFHYKVWESESEMPQNDPLFNFIPLPDWWYHYN